ncbi:MAG: hypothetical protein KZY74_12355 [Paenibacillaceae bacterium]|uniref:SpoVT-AbrB domain-containing protein n=1 Tax=Paenibacillus mellifer TaxID=2937794 RepID=A0A9X2BQZ9_9BACL|nr:hypothetical protein [Paenibacillus mellifer]MBW4840182.1 hypothetical protein [Paenibacillaceae bacterium]MCK8486755.1 hypothetical protein [Paenibacillus mellifer]
MALNAKGGKYFYAWSKILPDGSFYLPDQALHEYQIRPDSNIILMTGRNTAKGFSVVCKELIANSPLATIFGSIPQLQQFAIPEGQAITFKERSFCWVYLNSKGYFTLPLTTWREFGLKPGDQLLSLRATHLAFNNLSEGPYIEQAKQLRDIHVYE